MLTVLQVIPELDAGGAERTTLEIAEALTARGDRALVASEGGRLTPELTALGGVHVALPVARKNPWTLWRNVARLKALARGEGVALIHARSRAPAWSALWAARALGLPFVTTYHGRYMARSALKRGYNSIMARGDVVIANSHFIAEHIRAEHPFAEDRIVVIPRGVDVAAFDPDAVSSQRVEALKAAWGLAGDGRAIVLAPGRLTRWKGQGVMIAAFAHWLQGRAPGDDAVLVLPGDDQGRSGYRAELEAQIATLGLRERVRMPGHCADMPAAVRAAAIVVTPSTEPEAFGRVAAEAQCGGRLVIAADHGGARETVDPDVGGWRVTPADPPALADALAAFFALEPGERRAREAAVRTRAQSLYTTKALQKATLAVYGRLT